VLEAADNAPLVAKLARQPSHRQKKKKEKARESEIRGTKIFNLAVLVKHECKDA
jgi:hypothetical protein